MPPNYEVAAQYPNMKHFMLWDGGATDFWNMDGNRGSRSYGSEGWWDESHENFIDCTRWLQ